MPIAIAPAKRVTQVAMMSYYFAFLIVFLLIGYFVEALRREPSWHHRGGSARDKCV